MVKNCSLPSAVIRSVNPTIAVAHGPSKAPRLQPFGEQTRLDSGDRAVAGRQHCREAGRERSIQTILCKPEQRQQRAFVRADYRRRRRIDLEWACDTAQDCVHDQSKMRQRLVKTRQVESLPEG